MKNQVRKYDCDSCISFNSKNPRWNVLSNMYACKLTYDGETFNSVEQLFHYLVCRRGMELTKQCKNGFEVKKVYNEYMREMEHDDVLLDKYRILHLCHQVKYECCQEFRNALHRSGDKPLVEWCYWIYDNHIDAYGTYKDYDRNLYVGINMCGRSLMQLRDEHKNDAPTA